MTTSVVILGSIKKIWSREFSPKIYRMTFFNKSEFNELVLAADFLEALLAINSHLLVRIPGIHHPLVRSRLDKQ
jgi:hypothetical protein